MKLYYNPVSSYSQKVVIAFAEKGVAYTPEVVNLMDPAGRAAYQKIYPIGKVPFLRVEEKGLDLPESTSIIEWLEETYPNQGTKLVPADKDLARQVRIRDRFCDNYINEPMQKIFFDGMRPAGERDARGVKEARGMLDRAYASLEAHLATVNGPWMFGEAFTLADCSAAPPLAYARMVHPFTQYERIHAYVGRLVERPSFAKALAEAAPILAAMNAKG